MSSEHILIVDDESSIRSSLRGILEDEGYSVRLAASAEEGLDLLSKGSFGLVLLDIWLPEMSGLDALAQIQRLEERPAVVVISGHGTVETAVKAVKLGAYDFLEKPLSLDKVVLTVKNALHRVRLEEENVRLRERLKTRSRLIGKSASIRTLRSQIQAAAGTDARILLTGETGTGKELAARIIHQAGLRKEKRFVEVNCAALPEALIDAELFGCLKGYGPDPSKDKKGKLLQAGEGTLFLEGVEFLPPVTQASLLSALTAGSFEPIGGSETVPFDARVIASSKIPLVDLVRRGRFNEALYFKINVIPLHISPLRDRTEDIPVLVAYYLRIYCLEYGRKPKTIHPEALQAFLNYPWPGNVAELMNVLERFVILVEDAEIGPKHLNLLVETREQGPAPRPALVESLRRAEREAVDGALRRNLWDIGRAAADLDIPQEILREKIRDHRLTLLV
ncbi:MAG: sigma-54-dependent Fis family transcriptional regulator [Candidatus Aminicenantes bacterium]|nr:sigma-54-dependent Fis family transcriptional regulator [Candidatus Aminicenantes bacterium]